VSYDQLVSSLSNVKSQREPKRYKEIRRLLEIGEYDLQAGEIESTDSKNGSK